MRGKLVLMLGRRSVIRIIPAHAGQTVRARQIVGHVTDHPRACGANPETIRGRRRPGGSSPRMRGKRTIRRDQRGRVRIIPAHAGQTYVAAGDRGEQADHPRACGANGPRWHTYPNGRGSSPRMRGKRLWGRRARAAHRIIPAHAGQTASIVGANAPWPDHPRACGANKRKKPQNASPPGSSPRMRGKLMIVSPAMGGLRIIPAHAGQTGVRPKNTVLIADHPRACGANSLPLRFGGAHGGSSPRMRGKR